MMMIFSYLIELLKFSDFSLINGDFGFVILNDYGLLNDLLSN